MVAPARSSAETRSAQAEILNKRGIHLKQNCTINRSAAELFAFWRKFDNLPKFMNHLQEVRILDQTHSHWKTKTPIGSAVEWDAQIINEEPNRLIAWESTENAAVANAGSVQFVESPDGGTEVRVEIDYVPPGGAIGGFVAKLLGDAPEHQLKEDLQRFKQLMEAGGTDTRTPDLTDVQGEPS